MNKLTKIFLVSFSLTIFGCGNNQTTNDNSVENKDEEITKTEEENENKGNEIDYENTEVFKTLFVIDREGADLKQNTDKNSKTLGKYDFGMKVEVIEETELWLGVRERITREYTKDGVEFDSTAWEKVYVLKSQTDTVDKITLIPTDLNMLNYLSFNKEEAFYETPNELKEVLKVELINKELFESKQKNAVNLFVADTTEIVKKNGTIELPYQNKIKKIVDNNSDGDDFQEYMYAGQYDFLDKYVIKDSYYEGLDYKFFDKITGEETNSFGEFPYISTDKKHIICIYSNPYETTADLELYEVKDKKITQILIACYVNWMPSVEPAQMFWDTDGYFYVAVNHKNAFWTEEGHLNKKSKYIRIKLL